MSSALGHAATGVALCLALKPCQAARQWPWFVLLALAPDFDYLAYWLAGYETQPRITHTLVGCLATAALANRFVKDAETSPLRRWRTLAAPAVSHLALDLLVGVHSLPVFWPFVDAEIASPIGVLPSAAHVSLTNYYLWRNLLVETGVLWPVLWLSLALARRPAGTMPMPKLMFLLPPWLGFLAWSISLHR